MRLKVKDVRFKEEVDLVTSICSLIEHCCDAPFNYFISVVSELPDHKDLQIYQNKIK